MTEQLEVLLLDISGNSTLHEGVVSFFGDRPVVLTQVNDVALFETLVRNKKRFSMAVVLVSSDKSHLIAKSKRQVPTTVYQPHTFSHKKLLRFYSEQGEADG